MNIKIVCSDPVSRLLIKKQIEKCGHKIEPVGGYINAVVVDGNVEAVKNVRKKDELVEIIAIGTATDRLTIDDYYKAGASYYLVKPYRMADLKTVLDDKLDR